MRNFDEIPCDAKIVQVLRRPADPHASYRGRPCLCGDAHVPRDTPVNFVARPWGRMRPRGDMDPPSWLIGTVSVI